MQTSFLQNQPLKCTAYKNMTKILQEIILKTFLLVSNILFKKLLVFITSLILKTKLKAIFLKIYFE